MNDKANDIPELQQHLKKSFTYTSPDIQNEIIDIISSNICDALQRNVQTNKVWSLIADETSDILHQEQFSLCFRTVSEDLKIEEHFYKFAVVGHLYECIKQNMFDAGFPVDTLFFQCYDGASNMNGQYTGVAARVRELAPNGIYIHCHCHLLSLSLQNSCSKLTCIRNVLGTVNSIYNFIEASPKRHAIFVENQKLLIEGHRHRTIKLLSGTRWASRINAVKSILENFKAIISTLEHLSQESGKVASDAQSLLNNCATFEFLFYINLLHEIFSITSVLSDYLQSQKISIQQAILSAKSCHKLVLSRRNDEFFELIWQCTSESTAALNLEPPKLPRKISVSRRFDDSAHRGDHPSTVESMYRANFNEVLDTVATQIDIRFNENNLAPLQDIESVFLHKLKPDVQETKINAIREFYPQISGKVSAQLEVFKDMATSNQPVLETNPTMEDIVTFFMEKKLQSVFPQVPIFICITKLTITVYLMYNLFVADLLTS